MVSLGSWAMLSPSKNTHPLSERTRPEAVRLTNPHLMPFKSLSFLIRLIPMFWIPHLGLPVLLDLMDTLGAFAMGVPHAS